MRGSQSVAVNALEPAAIPPSAKEPLLFPAAVRRRCQTGRSSTEGTLLLRHVVVFSHPVSSRLGSDSVRAFVVFFHHLIRFQILNWFQMKIAEAAPDISQEP